MKKVLLFIALVLSSTVAAQTSQNVSTLRDVYTNLKEGQIDLSLRRYNRIPENGWYSKDKVVIRYNINETITIAGLTEPTYQDMIATVEDAFPEYDYIGTEKDLYWEYYCEDGTTPHSAINPNVRQLFFINYNETGGLITVVYNNSPVQWWFTVKIDTYEMINPSPYLEQFIDPVEEFACGTEWHHQE